MTPQVNALQDEAEIDTDCDWDEEAIREAITTARSIEDADPEAARQLLAQAQAAKHALSGTTSLREPYDPMRLYARILRFYGGAITDSDLDRMHYRRFLGYVREATIIAEEEQAEYDRATRRPSQEKVVEAQAAINEFPRAQVYEGEIAQLG